MAALRILVVNDEAPLAEALREGLAEAGHEVVATVPADIRLPERIAERTPLRSVAALLGPDDGGDADTPRARTVCSGVGTTDRQILAHVERTGERRLDAVQAARSCGSGCGSCRAEVTRLIEATPSPTARIA